MQHFIPQHILLLLLIHTNLTEALHNNSNRHSENQNTKNAADHANEASRRRHGHHVAIADRRDGNGGPPEGGWYRRELCVGLVLLRVVNEARKQKNGYRDEYH